MMPRDQLSLIQKSTISALWGLFCAALVYTLASLMEFTPLIGLIAAIIGFIGLFFTLLFKQLNHHQKQLATLYDGINSFNDGDFTIRIATEGDRHMQGILSVYNSLAASLKKQRQAMNQKELLLDSIIQASPMAIILFNAFRQVVYHNRQANELLKISGSLEGKVIHQLVEKLNPAFVPFLLDSESGLLSFELDDYKHSYYIANQIVTLDHQPHQLLICKNLSQELSREELQLWKNAIRLISHELNNSLAPITSLTTSAKEIIDSQKHTNLLPDILQTIQQRAENLHQFVSQYAEFARLPKPNISKQNVGHTLYNVKQLYPFTMLAPLPIEWAYFDQKQFEQVLINLLKNAHESGSAVDEIGLKVVVDYQRLRFAVVDRGSGIAEGKLTQVTLPFFSTKQGGTGLGLSLCSEIINAHQGELKIKNRKLGGVIVEFDIPLTEVAAC